MFRDQIEVANWLRRCTRGGCKRAMGTRAPMTLPQGVNPRWSLNFVSDALAYLTFLVLNVDWSRECLASVVDTSISGKRVVRELATIAERHGLPCIIVSDNGNRADQSCCPGVV